MVSYMINSVCSHLPHFNSFDLSYKRNYNNIEGVQKRTDEVTNFLIDFFIHRTCTQPPSEVCKVVLRLVNELSRKSEISVGPLIDKLTLNDEVDEKTVIDQMLYSVFDDGKINWGRVVVTFVFGLKLADEYKNKQLGDRGEEILKDVKKYIDRHLTNWIVDQGGWDAILHHFSDEKDIVAKLKSACVVVLTYGVGALTSIITY